MATFTFNFDTKIMQVDSPFTSTTCQEIHNVARTETALIKNVDDLQIVRTSGKQSLGDTNVGLTTELINGWILAFEARAGPGITLCTVSGGNLLARDILGNLVFPLSPTAFVSGFIAQSSSATLTGLESIVSNVVAGSSTTEIRTALTQPDFFYRGMIVSVENAAGKVARHIDEYTNLNGAIYVDEPLPFTPAADDVVRVLNSHSARFGQ